MPDTPTPGQIAFAAYWRIDPWTYDVPWAGLTPEQRHAWEAAAQAVRAQYKAEMAEAWQHGVLLWQAPPKKERHDADDQMG